MIKVLESINKVANKLSKVKINEKRIKTFADNILQEDLKTSHIAFAEYNWTVEQLIEIIFTFNTINYCFWAKPNSLKWSIKFNGKQLDGSIALFRTLEIAKKHNDLFTSGKHLSNLSYNELAEVLRGNVEIPLFKERLQDLRNVGKVLVSKFEGSWLNVLNVAQYDANSLVKVLVDNFPGFNDTSIFKGIKIGFYKRAQLNSKMINDILILNDKEGLTGVGTLTAFADYKVPQILRELDLISYSPQLAQKIDSFEIIRKDSEEENEIRIATILSVENIKKYLHKNFPFITAAHIDSLLWTKSQTLKHKHYPYHRTYTTSY